MQINRHFSTKWRVSGLSSLLTAQSASLHLSHSYSDGRGCYARCRLLIRSDLRSQYLTDGYFNVLGESNARPSDHQTTSPYPLYAAHQDVSVVLSCVTMIYFPDMCLLLKQQKE